MTLVFTSVIVAIDSLESIPVESRSYQVKAALALLGLYREELQSSDQWADPSSPSSSLSEKTTARVLFQVDETPSATLTAKYVPNNPSPLRLSALPGVNRAPTVASGFGQRAGPMPEREIPKEDLEEAYLRSGLKKHLAGLPKRVPTTIEGLGTAPPSIFSNLEAEIESMTIFNKYLPPSDSEIRIMPLSPETSHGTVAMPLNDGEYDELEDITTPELKPEPEPGLEPGLELETAPVESGLSSRRSSSGINRRSVSSRNSSVGSLISKKTMYRAMHHIRSQPADDPENDDDTSGRALFQNFDADGKGSISADDFRKLVYSMGYYLSDAELQIAMAQLDADGDHVISLDEFLTWWRKDDRFKRLQMTMNQAEAVQSATGFFQYFDVENKGYVDHDQFRRMYEYMHSQRNYFPPEMTFQEAYLTLKSDGVGYVSFNDYIAWLIKIGSIPT
ncbi:uncharacterized protein BJ171DRAFT_439634 [Polychytrium aggregatum]|uniref:uncharacterized protein n=1 Tax=Polychytrium aggregatum TaxID=110093 RepID=UPI0022FDB1FD|nr:uncharacterized protein BJ171DRAFT_439634 [Polychytrium aggregatum]KAI9207358.1 hypothetical protein BJ171DRAFT_439634 [Polychytrium aggregatum]